MMKFKNVLVAALLVSASTVASAQNNITPSLTSVDVMHNGAKVTISRTGDKEATVPAAYAKVGHHCPPFCLQPMEVAPGVETVGELEVIGYLKRLADGDNSVTVVDSRTPDWMGRGTIPGSVNIPWNKINVDVNGMFAIDAEANTLSEILTGSFNVTQNNGSWDFSNAKTIVMFCNGAWCPQSTNNIKTLARLGYPVNKLKWYRGGMQSWVSMGLSTQ